MEIIKFFNDIVILYEKDQLKSKEDVNIVEAFEIYIYQVIVI